MRRGVARAFRSGLWVEPEEDGGVLLPATMWGGWGGCYNVSNVSGP
jgi:hypothetical protein